jgi:hypothetical protein
MPQFLSGDQADAWRGEAHDASRLRNELEQASGLIGARHLEPLWNREPWESGRATFAEAFERGATTLYELLGQPAFQQAVPGLLVRARPATVSRGLIQRCTLRPYPRGCHHLLRRAFEQLFNSQLRPQAYELLYEGMRHVLSADLAGWETPTVWHDWLEQDPESSIQVLVKYHHAWMEEHANDLDLVKARTRETVEACLRLWSEGADNLERLRQLVSELAKTDALRELADAGNKDAEYVVATLSAAQRWYDAGRSSVTDIVRQSLWAWRRKEREITPAEMFDRGVKGFFAIVHLWQSVEALDALSKTNDEEERAFLLLKATAEMIEAAQAVLSLTPRGELAGRMNLSTSFRAVHDKLRHGRTFRLIVQSGGNRVALTTGRALLGTVFLAANIIGVVIAVYDGIQAFERG